MFTKDKYFSLKILLISIILTLFVNYPNMGMLSWMLSMMEKAKHTAYIYFFGFRLLYFCALIWVLLKYNLSTTNIKDFKGRLFHNFIIVFIAFGIYALIAKYAGPKFDAFSSMILFQFLVTWLVGSLIGHISHLYIEKLNKEQEIEKLKVENLQSRYDALTNQINPHFFFNSLNGIAALIRGKKEDVTLAYVNKLSDVFRYILQSEKKGLVTLHEELEFVQAFRYMMEVRFANKLSFFIDVDDRYLSLRLPVLSLLPLIDNVVVHNTIDSEHKMEVSIQFNDNNELVVSNTLYPKLDKPSTNGTGLRNLDNRFHLLLNQHIRFESDETTFRVYLPLKNRQDENTDS